MFFNKTGSTATTMAFTRELKKEEVYTDNDQTKSTNCIKNLDHNNEFAMRNTQNLPAQNFDTLKSQQFKTVDKSKVLMDNDDKWGDFNLFAEEKKKKPKGRFADKFASKLKK